MTKSHPGGISELFRLRISRMRRRIRLRSTAFPIAFFMLIPKRLCAAPLGRQNTTNCAEDRRFPPRYTASKSPRRTSRTVRGNACGKLTLRLYRERLNRRETLAALRSARRQHLAATFSLHACAKTVRLMATPHLGLKRTFGQRTLLGVLISTTVKHLVYSTQ